MQIRYNTRLTLKEYIKQEAWKQVSLDHCPLHPDKECTPSRHGYYIRQYPEPCKIARFICTVKRATISLLPDFFASRLPGTLNEVEDAVNVAEASSSLEEAAEILRSDILYPYSLRWLQRRIKYVRTALTLIAGLFPEYVYPDLQSFRRWLGCEYVLCTLRKKAGDYLHDLPMIIGLVPP